MFFASIILSALDADHDPYPVQQNDADQTESGSTTLTANRVLR